MPVHVVKQGDKYRVVDAHTGEVTKNGAGTHVDAGGHDSKAKAEAQARAINAWLHKEGKI